MLTIENLSLAFDENSRAFHRISLHVRENSITLLSGPSGCGKSSLLMAIARVIPEIVEGQLEGRICLHGRPIEHEDAKAVSEKIGYVFQDPDSQLCTFTVEDELAFGLENCRTAPAEMDREIDRLLDLLGIHHLRKRNLNQLSGGEKQKVAIASVLAVKPVLLLLDEPTANLDQESTLAVVELIRRLRDEWKITILLVEHKLREFSPIIDDVLHMSDGKVRQVPAGEYLQQVQQNWSLPLRAPEDHIRSKPHRKPVLQANNLQYAYHPARPVLRNVSFCLGEGEILAITGENGAGKSTLARLLMGLIRPTGGSIQIGEQEISRMGAREIGLSMGIAFQNPEHQFIKLTVEKELSFSLEVSGVSRAAESNRLDETLHQFDLDHCRHNNPFQLSQGQKRRLSTATMMMNGQKILILDEPTYGQDPENLINLIQLLYRINQEGVSVLMITHDPELVRRCCDRNLVLIDGSMEERQVRNA